MTPYTLAHSPDVMHPFDQGALTGCIFITHLTHGHELVENVICTFVVSKFVYDKSVVNRYTIV